MVGESNEINNVNRKENPFNMKKQQEKSYFYMPLGQPYTYTKNAIDKDS